MGKFKLEVMRSKILLLCIFVFLFCFLFLTGCTSKSDRGLSDELVKEGLELYREREYKKAMEKFVVALEKYPANTEAYIALMDIFLDKGLLDEAENLAQEANVRINKTDSAKIYSMVGNKYYEMDEYDSAEKMYEKATEIEEGKIGLARVKIQKGEISNAQKVLKGGSDNAGFLLLSAYLTLGDWEKGSKIINKVDLNKVKDEGIKEQVSRLREIYTIAEDDSLYRDTSLAGEYINAGYPTLALKILSEHVDKLEEYSDGQFFLGKAYLDTGSYDDAIEALNKAIMLDIQMPNVYMALARAYLFNKDIEKALDTYKEAIALAIPENSEEIVQEYVNVLIENNMMNVAKSLLIDLIKERDIVWMNIALAQVYYSQKDLAKMSEVLTKLESEPNMTQAETRNFVRYKLLFAMEDIKDVNKIENLIERYTVFNRYNPEIPLFKGKLSMYAGDKIQAKEFFERAIELDLKGEIAEQATKLLATLN